MADGQADQPLNTKHLEFIQAIIARMANHAFLLKGWTVTLSAALFTLAVKESSREFALVAIVPALVFWGLDAYYLRQERLFRRLYDAVSQRHADGSSPPLFSLSTRPYIGRVHSWPRTFFSPTILLLHGAVVLALVVGVCLVPVLGQKGG
jgi:hypothetical protein